MNFLIDNAFLIYLCGGAFIVIMGIAASVLEGFSGEDEVFGCVMAVIGSALAWPLIVPCGAVWLLCKLVSLLSIWLNRPSAPSLDVSKG